MQSDLERFIDAQRDVYPMALEELRRGRKTGHWMWFVFPQVAGLGRSPQSERYAIGSLAMARSYLAHPVLGPRLREVSRAVLVADARTAEDVLGSIDARKLRSSMTLFARAAPDEGIFREVLERWFGGVEDDATLTLLRAAEDTTAAGS